MYKTLTLKYKLARRTKRIKQGKARQKPHTNIRECLAFTEMTKRLAYTHSLHSMDMR